MEQSSDKSKEKPEWLRKILEELNFQDNFATSEMKTNQFEHIGNELHSEGFAQEEIINEARIILEDLAVPGSTREGVKNRIRVFLRQLLDNKKNTISEPISKPIKKAAYSFLLERL